MNRRSFVAAVPALIPAIAASQEASPQAETMPESFLRDLIQAMFVDRSITAASDLVSPASDRDAMVLHFANIIEWLDDTYGEERMAVSVKILTSDGANAISLIDIGDPREAYVFLYITTDSAGITGFRSQWGEF